MRYHSFSTLSVGVLIMIVLASISCASFPRDPDTGEWIVPPGCSDPEARYTSLDAYHSYLRDCEGRDLGDPIDDERSGPGGRGRYRSYERGGLYIPDEIQSPRRVIKLMNPDLYFKYRTLDGPNGVLGYPTQDDGDAVNRRRGLFENGMIVSTKRYGTYALHGPLWQALQNDLCPVGWDVLPVTDLEHISGTTSWRILIQQDEERLLYLHLVSRVEKYAVTSQVCTGYSFVRVPEGDFGMGRSGAEERFPTSIYSGNESPYHTVTLPTFWIMETEVTNEQYGLCVNAKACPLPHNERWSDPSFAHYPVTNINWTEAKGYARWVGGRLPTEAEWEKACRGVEGRIWPWGDNPPPDISRLNFADSGFNDPVPVGQYPLGASPYGALDMAGNVFEWTSSLLWDYVYDADDGREDPRRTEIRVMRGGAYHNLENPQRCAFRGRGHEFANQGGREDLGFRVALSSFGKY